MTSSSAIADGKPHSLPIMACCFRRSLKSWATAVAAVGFFSPSDRLSHFTFDVAEGRTL